MRNSSRDWCGKCFRNFSRYSFRVLYWNYIKYSLMDSSSDCFRKSSRGSFRNSLGYFLTKSTSEWFKNRSPLDPVENFHSNIFRNLRIRPENSTGTPQEILILLLSVVQPGILLKIPAGVFTENPSKFSLGIPSYFPGNFSCICFQKNYKNFNTSS